MTRQELEKAIEEVRALEEYDRLQRAKIDNPLKCPDCGCHLEVVNDFYSPHGVKLVHVKHY